MAEIYYDLVVNGEMKLEDVPDRWREQVEKLLKERMKNEVMEGIPEPSKSENQIAHRA